MKYHRHLIAQLVESLEDIFVRNAYSDKVIERRFKSNPKWGSRDRRYFAETVYEIVRSWRWVWHVSGLPDAEYLDPEKITLPRLWRIWTVHTILKTERKPDFEESAEVTLCEVFDRQEAGAPLPIQESIQTWFHEKGLQAYGKEWPTLVNSLNHPASVFLRANSLKLPRRADQAPAEVLCQKLQEEGIETERVPNLPDAVKLVQRTNVTQLKAYQSGWFEIQDAASQWIAPFLQASPGHFVVDACAGGGGKSLHLASLMKNQGRLVSCDVHLWKLNELQKRAQRNGARRIETLLLKSPADLNPFHRAADRLLLDVPCSGLGVLRRKPDTKWKTTEADLQSLTELQASLLIEYSQVVKTGGKMVYATCSLLPEENELQVQAFLKQQPAWELEEEVHFRPDREGFDGFYAARLRRLSP